MLPKKNRGLGKEEIDAVFAKNTSTKNEYVTILKREIKEEVNPRFAVLVSKKLAKRAVDRNRMKRLVFDQIQENIFVYKPGHYVVLVKKVLSKREDFLRLQEVFS
jgi:ribonuclease P protein component